MNIDLQVGLRPHEVVTYCTMMFQAYCVPVK